MAKLNKKWATLVGVSGAALFAAAVVGCIFLPSIKRLCADVTRASKILEEEKALLVKKTSLQSEWEAKKDHLDQGLDPDSVLNAWVKDLLAAAQAESLTLEKLEPAGIRSGPEGKALTVFISFEGDIRQLIRLIYQLVEKDPLARIVSFDVRLDEESKRLSFELLLGKVV